MAYFEGYTLYYRGFAFTLFPENLIYYDEARIDEAVAVHFIHITLGATADITRWGKSLQMRIGDIHQMMPLSSLPIIVTWMKSLYRSQIGYLSKLPRELRRELFLYLKYGDITRLCITVKQLSWICEDESFWREKVKELGVTEEEWKSNELESRSRYFDFSLKLRRYDV